MRALQVDGPAADSSTTRVVEIAEPIPGPGQVSIDVAYAGINFMDVMTRRGDPGYASSGWPLVPGLEVAGTIRAIGPNVSTVRVGDRVAAPTPGGGLAQVAVVAASMVAPVPAAVDLTVAASAPLMLATAILLLRDAAQVRIGERVLMHAASGGVGSVVPQVARALGAGTCVGIVANTAKKDAALAAGWDGALIPSDQLATAARDAGGGGFDVILDPTGTTSLDLDLELAAPGARIVLFGNAGGTTPTALPPFARLLGGNIGLLGFSITALSRADPARVTDALRCGLTMLERAQLSSPVTIVESLAGVGAVHDLLASRAGEGKYVVRLVDH